MKYSADEVVRLLMAKLEEYAENDVYSQDVDDGGVYRDPEEFIAPVMGIACNFLGEGEYPGLDMLNRRNKWDDYVKPLDK